jgi:hypothetical protein
LLDYVEHHTDLDVIAITDHDSLEGALEARELVARHRYSFELIVGEEITTLEGHLLALFLEQEVPSMRPLHQTIQAVHAQGGICVVSHPMSWLTRSVGRRALERIIASPQEDVYFDGLETTNPVAGRVTSKKAELLNRTRYGLAETGGSDAHFLPMVGSSYTRFPGHTAADLRRAIQERTTAGVHAFSVTLFSLGADQILAQQWKSMVVLPSRHVGRFVSRLLKGASQ